MTTQWRAVRLDLGAIVKAAQRSDRAIGLLAVPRDALAPAHLLRAQPVNRSFVQKHVEAPAMHRALVPMETSQTSARSTADFAPVEADQRPFFRRNAAGVHFCLINAKVGSFAHRVRLQVDPHA
ncbi:hypothetical protein [Novosphingobium sp. BW1]|uniref:hypothetical protein n=1 Tax=Novosphingobium sp. BW1 TaxID=2592621 RepID=UPI0011DEFEA8|nr:hypothetical protein [Novosphingobium sp. BW1]TYC90752.1 hypothetical protein FMM79_05655 [Novosphingobium sp. BW1]